MRNSSESGMTLIESLMAVLLLSLGLLAIASMFLHAMRENAVSADMGIVAAAATAQLERLRELDYESAQLSNGGSLIANTTSAGIDYFDGSGPEVLVRWQVTNNASPPRTKVIAIRAIALHSVVGRPKEATLVSLRGE